MVVPEIFEWDEANALAHEAKHGVPFEAGPSAFLDPRRIDSGDDRRDHGEERRNVLGLVDGVLLNVTYAPRGRTARLISVRRASRKERQTYAAENREANPR